MDIAETDLERLRSRLAGASNRQSRALARELFADAPWSVACLRAAVLRLYALRLEPDEWARLLLYGEPAVIVVDDQEAALLGNLLEEDPETASCGL